MDDLLKWDNSLYTEKVIKKQWLEKAWNPYILPNGQTTNYGLGWGSSNFNGIQFIEHGGGINGFFSDGLRVPSEHLYVVILSNSTIIWPPIISSAIALHLLKKTLPQPSSVHIDNETLKSYTGVYALHRPTEWQMYHYFTIKNDTLFAQPQGSSKEALLYVSKDLFVSEHHNPYYFFHRNEKGDVVSVEFYNEPLKDGGLSPLELKTTNPLPEEKQAITLDVKKLELLQGKYDFGGGIIVPITIEGNKIYIKLPGPGEREKREIFAENETNFFLKSANLKIEFIIENGKVSKMVQYDGGAKYEGKKIE